MAREHVLAVPERFLLTIAVYGNMGDGELPDGMRVWAEQECQRLGLTDKLRQMQAQRLAEMRLRIANVVGREMATQIEAEISSAIDKLLPGIKKGA